MKILFRDSDGNLLQERSLSPGDPDLTVGRDPACEVCIPHLSVSRKHLLLRAVSATGILIQDLGSSFGTFIDGRKIAPARPTLVEGVAIIQLSKEIYVFTEPGTTGASPDSPAGSPDPIPEEKGVPDFLGVFEQRNRRFVQDLFAEIAAWVPDTRQEALAAHRDRMEKTIGNLSAILMVSYALNSITRYQRLLEYTMDVAIRVIGAERGCLSLYDEELQRFKTVVARRMGNQEVAQEMQTSQSLIRRSFETGETIIIADTSAGGEIARSQSILLNHIKSVAITPLFYNGSGIGVLYLDNRLSLGGFYEENQDILKVFASLASVAINNARLHYLATTDGLTELTNRRSFLQRLLEEFYRSRRYGLSLSLIILDIDHFKSINDSYGHPAGDKVLKKLGGLLKDHVRVHDLPGRYGGEEFVILLPQTDLDGARILAEKLRSLVEATPFPIGRAQEIRVTISLGVARIDASRMTEPMALVKTADEALYHAKESGRNRVVTAPAPAGPAGTPA